MEIKFYSTNSLNKMTEDRVRIINYLFDIRDIGVETCSCSSGGYLIDIYLKDGTRYLYDATGQQISKKELCDYLKKSNSVTEPTNPCSIVEPAKQKFYWNIVTDTILGKDTNMEIKFYKSNNNDAFEKDKLKLSKKYFLYLKKISSSYYAEGVLIRAEFNNGAICYYDANHRCIYEKELKTYLDKKKFCKRNWNLFPFDVFSNDFHKEQILAMHELFHRVLSKGHNKPIINDTDPVASFVKVVKELGKEDKVAELMVSFLMKFSQENKSYDQCTGSNVYESCVHKTVEEKLRAGYYDKINPEIFKKDLIKEVGLENHPKAKQIMSDAVAIVYRIAPELEKIIDSKNPKSLKMPLHVMDIVKRMAKLCQ